jgi:exodeoxyribonuclease VII small subunit
MTNKATDKGADKANENAPVRFEEAYQELSAIIDQLESGNLTLDESMALFERGRKLALICEDQLDSAELKVSQLLGDADGNMHTEDME